MLAYLFYIVAFISFSGAIAWLVLLFVQSVIRMKMPHYLLIILMVFFMFPVKFHNLKLIDPDPTHTFLPALVGASKVWLIGMIAAMVYYLTKIGFLRQAVRKFEVCTNQRVLDLLEDCASRLNIKKIPAVYYGNLKELASVAFLLRPVIILSELAVDKLNDYELRLVLMHELLHIKRRHVTFQRVFDLICAIHWFNPFAWIARYEFSLSCELDCDQCVIRQLPGKDAHGYAKTMLKLMELSFEGRRNLPCSVSFMASIRLKQRFEALFIPVSNTRKVVMTVASVLIICSVTWFALMLSRSVFYPYPSYKSNAEWSDVNGTGH